MNVIQPLMLLQSRNYQLKNGLKIIKISWIRKCQKKDHNIKIWENIILNIKFILKYRWQKDSVNKLMILMNTSNWIQLPKQLIWYYSTIRVKSLNMKLQSRFWRNSIKSDTNFINWGKITLYLNWIEKLIY